ncbi:proline-rich receptor-like protein kinase PERK10 [Belonocnema kinseyi]|uniref:proline-rich receptor-like protein kinase PERK10 n=1 Tax=Belonocnema kinseyi TaxID=2817044 RepID=UPI00143D3B57|nr:proline-rich receptor-like protein kinase PERK10 [Belonocnema kinseyi]
MTEKRVGNKKAQSRLKGEVTDSSDTQAKLPETLPQINVDVPLPVNVQIKQGPLQVSVIVRYDPTILPIQPPPPTSRPEPSAKLSSSTSSSSSPSPPPPPQHSRSPPLLPQCTPLALALQVSLALPSTSYSRHTPPMPRTQVSLPSRPPPSSPTLSSQQTAPLQRA